MPPCPRAEGSGDAQVEPERPTLADVFRRHAAQYRAGSIVSPEQDRLLRDACACRTAALGGHLWVCPECDFEQPHYNSCRNRSCPSCQALDQRRWIEARSKRMLSVGHHHVVFTVPAQLRPVARGHPREFFGVLFRAVSATLAQLAQEVLDAQLGVTAVLHTWTRTLQFHPHIHCIVTAGGLSSDGQRWVERTGYLFHVDRMKAVFRSHLLAELQRLRDRGELPLAPDHRDEEAWRELLDSLPDEQRWVVFIEPPLGRSRHVLEYLGRYTHRIAISDHRLVDADDQRVEFRTRGDDTMALPPLEFLGRFLQHVLPKGFRKIRHSGLYSPGAVRTGRLDDARRLVGDDHGEDEGEGEGEDDDTERANAEESWLELFARLVGQDPLLCPRCRRARLRPAPLPSSRAPPEGAP